MIGYSIKFGVYFFRCRSSDNPTLILISGYTSDLTAWRSIAEKLADKFYILIFDNQGIGLTTDDNGAFTIEIMAENIKALMDALNIEKSFIAGFAMGSTIAQTIAYLYPNSVSQLILISSLMKWSEHAKALCERLCELRSSNDFEQYANVIYDTCFSENYKAKHEKTTVINNLSNLLTDSQTKTNQRRQVEALKAFDSSSWVNQLDVPIIVVSALSDQFVTPDEGKKLADTVRNGEQIIIPNSGHAILEEASEILIRIIEEKCTHYLSDSSNRTTALEKENEYDEQNTFRKTFK